MTLRNKCLFYLVTKIFGQVFQAQHRQKLSISCYNAMEPKLSFPPTLEIHKLNSIEHVQAKKKTS